MKANSASDPLFATFCRAGYCDSYVAFSEGSVLQGGVGECYSTGSMSEKPFLNSDLMVEWSKLTPARARVEIREAIDQAKEAVATICAVEAPTYENTFAALEASGAAVMRGWQRLHHLSSVMDSPELREVINELSKRILAGRVDRTRPIRIDADDEHLTFEN